MLYNRSIEDDQEARALLIFSNMKKKQAAPIPKFIALGTTPRYNAETPCERSGVSEERRGKLHLLSDDAHSTIPDTNILSAGLQQQKGKSVTAREPGNFSPS